MSNFGMRFGQLVRKFREAQGLSAAELAQEAFGDQAKRSRISELENGKVKNPQAKTISALQVYLNIPQEDLDACRQPMVEPVHSVENETNKTVAEQMVSHLTAELTNTAKQLGVTEDALTKLAKRVVDDVPDAEQALVELENAIERLIKLQNQKGSTANVDVLIDRVIKEMADLSAKGENDEASLRADDAMRDWYARQEREKVAAINLLDAALETDLLRRDTAKAASRIVDKVKIEHTEQADIFDALRSEFIKRNEEGLRVAGTLDLQVAQHLAALCVELAKSGDQRGTALNDRAIALRNLGERAVGEAGLKFLQDAVSSYDLALEVTTRDTRPADWAMTQMNRAIALGNLGERAGAEEGLKFLQDAVSGYDLALVVYTRDTMPADWAMTQMNRATALLRLGERGGGEGGLKFLKDAVSAIDLALEIRTRDTMPAQWAMTQMNRAIALGTLGERAGGEDGHKFLQDALSSFDLALEVRTRDTMPAQWAMTQMNRAIELRNLGERVGGEEGLKFLQDAVSSFDLALEVYSEPGMEYYADVTRKNREIALKAFEKLKSDLA